MADDVPNSEKLKGATQENVLTLLCYDDQAAKIITNTISPSMFQNKIYRTIAEKAFDFIHSHDTVPREHIADELEDLLDGKKNKQANIYGDTLLAMREVSRTINRDYVLSRLRSFIVEQNLKELLSDAVDLMNAGKTEEAQALLVQGADPDLNLFNPGVFFSNGLSLLQEYTSLDAGYHVGIDQLDQRGFHLQRKEMMLFMALSGKGKTWWLTHLGKMALLQGAKVLHVTLEVSEKILLARYMQAMFSISKRDGKVLYPTIVERRRSGITFDFEEVSRPSLQDQGINKILKKSMEKFSGKGNNLLIKEFPMRGLTVKQLIAFLDTLDASYGFTPDVLLVDYPDLFQISPQYKRVETGIIYEELRGLATTRNLALGAVTQSNRQSAKIDLMTGTDTAEDFSKYQTADNFITYNQTDFEENLGLARLYVDKARNDVAKYITLISQSYEIGQFVMGSANMPRQFMKEGYGAEVEKLNRDV